MFYSTVLIRLRPARVISADSEKLCLLTLSQWQYICTTQNKKECLKMVVWAQRMYIHLQHWSKRASGSSVSCPETFSLWPRSSGPFLIEPDNQEKKAMYTNKSRRMK